MRTEWAAASGHMFWTPGTDCVVLEPLLCRFGFMFCFVLLSCWDLLRLAVGLVQGVICVLLHWFFVFPISLSELRGLHPFSAMLPLLVFKVEMAWFLICSACHSPCTALQTFFFPLNTEWPYWTCRITSPNFKLFNNLVSTCTYATLCDLFKKELITHFDLS